MRKRIASLLLCFVMLAGLLPTTVMAANDAEPLPAPAGLEWGKYYAHEGGILSEDCALPGMYAWDTSNVVDRRIGGGVWVYKKAMSGDDMLVATLSAAGGVGSGRQDIQYIGWLLNHNACAEGASGTEAVESVHLDSGNYYFEIRYNGSDNSTSAKSDIWSYTKPSAKLDAPSDFQWNGNVLSWTAPKTATVPIYAYLVVYYRNGQQLGMSRLVSGQETSCDFGSIVEAGFSVRMMALSRDMTQIQDSDWSEMSPAYRSEQTTVRSASLTGTIRGEVHQQIDAGISLYLTGDSFDPSRIEGYDAESGTLSAGTDLTDCLLLDTPVDGEFHLFNAADLKKGDQMMAVRVMGISSQNYDGQVNMTISGQMLASGKELAVTPSDDCMWHISPQAGPSQPEEGKYDLWFFGKQVTVDNAADILGDGAVAFDPLTNTLTLRPGSGNSYGVAGNTPMLKSELDSLTLRVERSVMMRSQDGYGIEAKNLTVEIVDPDVTLTVMGKTAAFSQTPLNTPEEIFAGADEGSAAQKSNWKFDLSATPYVRLGVHKWNSQWRWNTYMNVHWRECGHADCAAVKDAAKHTLEWWEDEEPYGAEPGSRHQGCQICGYKGEAESVPGTAPGITTDSLLSSELGMAYSAAVKATGTAPLTWKITSGKLPDGLTLNTETGEITGKPTKAGNFPFTVQVTNQVPGAAVAQKSYTMEIKESSNELKFVKWITQNGLKNANEDTKENIQNAIYNLMFKAQFRATGRTGKAKTAANKFGVKFTGTEEIMADFPVQNVNKSSSQVHDDVLGTMYFSESGAGCMAYALFATTYTYSYSGKIRICEPTGYKTVKVKDKKGNIVEEKVGQFTAARVKEFIQQWADPGEHIRYNAPHSLVFLGEADDNGFYCISYGGGRRRNHKPNHTLQVEYRTYADIAKKANGSLRIRDVNNGSYYEGGKNVKQWADVKAAKKNKKSKTIIRLHCPVEASVTLNGFILDSEYGPFERGFGTVERDGDSIVFTLDYSEDYVLDIRGTGEGSMDAEIAYLDGDGVSLGSQMFEGMPITADTAITSGALMPESTVVLYYLEDDVPVSAWGTNLGETATGPSDDFLSVNNTSDEEDEEEPVPSDSSGDSAAAGNGITVDSSANGSVTVSPKNASKGDTVTVTVRPDTGYQLDTITVTDQAGKEITLTDKGNGTFTFTMPASPVTVKAAFKPAAFPAFTDVPSGSYYEEAVRWAAENGVTTGTDPTHFSPDGICTRAQAVTFLWRAAGSPEPKSVTMPFTDVAAGSYCYDAVLWAVENGITKGTSSTVFNPNVTCTRAQIVTFLWRSQNSPAAGTINPFADVKSGAYYADAVLWAVKNDITKGTGATTFSPDADCTRAQIVTFLWRTLA